MTLELFNLSGITRIDSSRNDLSYTSRYYTKRAKLKIKEMKCTFLVDVKDNMVLYVHIKTARKHDTQIGPQISERSAGLIGGKGFDDREYRKRCREFGIRSVDKVPKVHVALEGLKCQDGRRALQSAHPERERQLINQVEV